MNQALNRKRPLLHPASIIILFSILIFAPLCTFPFVRYDDQDNIYANPAYNPPQWAEILKTWERPYLSMYIPVTYTAWGGIAELAWGRNGLDSHLFHLVNLLAHAAAGVLVYGILTQLRFNQWAGLLGALFFVVHPVQVEAVAWATGLKDVLSGVLGLAALWLYLRHRRGAYWGATIVFILALLAKPSAAVVPVMALVLDCWVLKIDWRRALRGLWVWFVLAAATLVIAKLAQPGATLHVPVTQRIFVAGDAVAFYLAHIGAPVHLAIDYGRSPRWLMQQPIRWVNWLVPVVVGLMLWSKGRKMAWPAFAVFIAALLPVLGLTSFDFQQHSTVADRYLYLAMMGAAMMVAVIVQRWPRRGATVIVLLLAMYGYKTIRHEWVWNNTERLFRQTLALNPTSDLANNAMGIIVGNQAMARNDSRLRDKSIGYFERAIATNPGNVPAHYNLATMLFMAGQRQRVAEELDILRRLRPGTKRTEQMENLLKGHGKWFSVDSGSR